MKGKVSIEKDGTLTIITTEGTFEQGAEDLAKLLKALSAQGIQISKVAVPEQHRHDDTQTHTHSQEDHNHAS